MLERNESSRGAPLLAKGEERLEGGGSLVQGALDLGGRGGGGLSEGGGSGGGRGGRHDAGRRRRGRCGGRRGGRRVRGLLFGRGGRPGGRRRGLCRARGVGIAGGGQRRRRRRGAARVAHGRRGAAQAGIACMQRMARDRVSVAAWDALAGGLPQRSGRASQMRSPCCGEGRAAQLLNLVGGFGGIGAGGVGAGGPSALLFKTRGQREGMGREHARRGCRPKQRRFNEIEAIGRRRPRPRPAQGSNLTSAIKHNLNHWPGVLGSASPPDTMHHYVFYLGDTCAGQALQPAFGLQGSEFGPLSPPS